MLVQQARARLTNALYLYPLSSTSSCMLMQEARARLASPPPSFIALSIADLVPPPYRPEYRAAAAGYSRTPSGCCGAGCGVGCGADCGESGSPMREHGGAQHDPCPRWIAHDVAVHGSSALGTAARPPAVEDELPEWLNRANVARPLPYDNLLGDPFGCTMA